jgi:hypothetical protein
MTAAPRLVTHVGRAVHGDNRFRGHSVRGELAGHRSASGLLALAITGLWLDDDTCRALDDLAACMTVADPRVWPMKMVRLASAYGGVASGVAVGTLVVYSASIGPLIAERAARSLAALDQELGEGPRSEAAASEGIRRLLVRERRVAGLGVFFRRADERFEALQRCVVERGLQQGRFWLLMLQLAAAMRAGKGLEPNIGLGSAALLLDLGVGIEHIAPLTVALLSHTLWANAVEGAAQSPSVLERLPHESVEYRGPAARISPRAQAIAAKDGR